jgi:hypothetical protein
MKKKSFALSLEFFIQILLVVLFLVFGTMLIIKIFGPSLLAKSIDAICIQSVQANSKTRVMGINTETIKVNCPTKFITFHLNGYNEEFEENDKGMIKFNPFVQEEEKEKPKEYKNQAGKCSLLKDENEKEKCMFYSINSIIANEMKRCWDDFSLGNLRVFSVYQQKTQCVVCTNLLFDSEMREQFSSYGFISEKGPEDPSYSLDMYMKTTPAYFVEAKYIKNDKDRPPSIFEYTQDILDKNWETPPYDYMVSKDYAVVFSALNEYFVKEVAEDIWNQIKGKITHQTYPDEPNFINTLHFISNEEVPVYCGTWA